jgi:hypothetical protein
VFDVSAVSAPEPLDLLGAVAYGELSAFTRLAADAERAPGLAGRAELARLAAVELDHYRRVSDHLAERGIDVVAAMQPFVAPLDAFTRRTAPRDWGESLVSAHLGRGLASDLQLDLATAWEGPLGELVREVAPDPGYEAFAAREVRALCEDARVQARLALWGRRLLGETLAAASAVLDEHPGAAELVGAGGGRAALFKRLKSQHGKRMHVLGL